MFQACARLWAAILAAIRTTYLPRDQVIEALDDYVRRSVDGGAYVTSVMVLEIDDFPKIDAAHPGAEVEALQRALEQRIRGGPCARDMLRRLSDGRFAIVPAPLDGARSADVAAIAAAVQQICARPVDLAAGPVFVTMSAGYARFDQVPDPTGERLLEAATVALRHGRVVGPGMITGFAPGMMEPAAARLARITTVQDAMAAGDIRPHFQPQVSLSTGEITGVEALARWVQPEEGMKSPAEFLPLLEELDQMRALGLLMLRRSLEAMQGWERLGVHVPTVGLNLSTAELRNPELVMLIEAELARTGMTADRLSIEVLETVVGHEASAEIMSNLRQLAAIGCQIDLDDFGTGSASITAIRHFGVDRIKIDRSFVTDIGARTEQRTMVAAMVLMARQLSVGTLAEGAETQAELDALRAQGCDGVQGYAIARPMSAEALADWACTRLMPAPEPMHA